MPHDRRPHTYPSLYSYFAVSPQPTWCRLAPGYIKTRGQFLIVRGELPDLLTAQTYNFSFVASNSDGNASVPITATLPAPRRTARYAAPNASLPLAQQTARQPSVWFTDRFPPEGFGLYGQYAGREEVRKEGRKTGTWTFFIIKNQRHSILIDIICDFLILCTGFGYWCGT